MPKRTNSNHNEKNKEEPKQKKPKTEGLKKSNGFFDCD